MAITKTARPVIIADKAAARLAPAKPFAFKGKGAMLRTTALQGIASLAYIEGKSRADTIAQLRIVLGKSPTDAELGAAQLEYMVGRVAQRLPVANGATVADSMTLARQLITQYAAPVKDGVKANKLRKGQLGRRTPEQHKMIRAAETAWSLVKAEMGYSTATTQAEKNKRQAAAPGSTARGKKSPAITHSELVKPDGPMTAKAAASYLDSMAATMLAFCNKHAGVIDAPRAMSVKRFHAAMMQIAKDAKAVEGALA